MPLFAFANFWNVIAACNHKVGTAVKLVADFLLLLGQALKERFGQNVALLQELSVDAAFLGKALKQTFVNLFRHLLTVTMPIESFAVDTVSGKEVDN